MSTYPEHEKLKLVKDRSQAIGEFLEWCDELGYELGYRDGNGDMWPLNKPIHKLLAEHFEIDEQKLEDEKRAMLEEQRRLNKET